MNYHLLMLLIAVLAGTHHIAEAQEGVNRKKPLMVSHLSAENRVLLTRPGAPKHTIFSKLICFKVKCRNYIGWRTKQRSMRFRGYKDGGKVPLPGKVPPIQNNVPLPVRDTALVNVAPPLAPPDTSAGRERIFVLDEVLFELNSARFNEHFIFRLDSLVRLLAKHKRLKADISGHTDNTGNTSYNLKLSNDRAAAVANYLIVNNIAPNRISFEGLGSARPIAENKTEAGRRKNRRVEIRLSEE